MKSSFFLKYSPDIPETGSFLDIDNISINPTVEDYRNENLINIEFFNNLIKQVTTEKLIYIQGDSCTGKTTFLKYIYIWNKNYDDSYDLIYIDFSVQTILPEEFNKFIYDLENIWTSNNTKRIIILENLHKCLFKKQLINWLERNKQNEKNKQKVILTSRSFSGFELEQISLNKSLDQLIGSYSDFFRKLCTKNKMEFNFLEEHAIFTNFLKIQKKQTIPPSNNFIRILLILKFILSKPDLNINKEINFEKLLSNVARWNLRNLTEEEKRIILNLAHLTLHEYYPPNEYLTENFHFFGIKDLQNKFPNLKCFLGIDKSYLGLAHPDYGEILTYYKYRNDEMRLYKNAEEIFQYWNYLYMGKGKNFHAFRILDNLREKNKYRLVVKLIFHLINKEIIDNEHNEFLDEEHNSLKLRVYRSLPESVNEYIKLIDFEIKYNLKYLSAQEVNEIFRGLKDHYISIDPLIFERLWQRELDKFNKLEQSLLNNEITSDKLNLLGRMSYTIGRIYFLKDELDKAKYYFRKSLELRKKQDPPDIQGTSYQYRELSKIAFLENKEAQKIRDMLTMANQIAESEGDSRIILTLLAWSLLIVPNDIFLESNFEMRVEKLMNLLTEKAEQFPFQDITEAKAILRIVLNKSLDFSPIEQNTIAYKIFNQFWDKDEFLPSWIKVSDRLIKQIKFTNPTISMSPNFKIVEKIRWKEEDLLYNPMVYSEIKAIKRSIELAKWSIEEEGKKAGTTPKVGAVVVKKGKTLAESCRGRLVGENWLGKNVNSQIFKLEVDGAHAEFLALKCSGKNEDELSGATLITTLEPCIKRGIEKKACCEHIEANRIKKVIIGMVDPNPEIGGKGILYLQNKGVEVELFPHEDYLKVKNLNRDYLKNNLKTIKRNIWNPNI